MDCVRSFRRLSIPTYNRHGVASRQFTVSVTFISVTFKLQLLLTSVTVTITVGERLVQSITFQNFLWNFFHYKYLDLVLCRHLQWHFRHDWRWIWTFSIGGKLVICILPRVAAVIDCRRRACTVDQMVLNSWSQVLQAGKEHWLKPAFRLG